MSPQVGLPPAPIVSVCPLGTLGRKRRLGFSLLETMFALTVAGLLAMFLVPKLLSDETNQQSGAIVQDSFNTVGTMFLSREEDSTLPAANIGSGTENLVFAQYLYDHLKRQSFTVDPAAAGVTAATFCAATPADEQDFFVMQSGAIIRSICDENTVTPNSIRVQMRVPTNGARTVDFTLVIPEDAAATGASTGRFTTLYGFENDNDLTINPGDCGTADIALKLTETCP